MRIAVISDIHGNLHALDGVLAAVDGESPDAVWCLGDLVGYGPRPNACTREVAARAGICLAGNHDLGFLDFLTEPDPAGLFATNGGIETALSYGVTLDLQDLDALAVQHGELVLNVPDAHRRFIGDLVFSAEFGDFFFCHAGVMPGVPLDEQQPRDLTWIREQFLDHGELYAKVIVHGHTPTHDPEIRTNRINVDTGAFATGVLTSLLIEGSDKQLMQVVEE